MPALCQPPRMRDRTLKWTLILVKENDTNTSKQRKVICYIIVIATEGYRAEKRLRV